MQHKATNLASSRFASVWIGLLAGGFGGLVGLGGGAVMVPLLVRVIGLRQVHAHGTSLSVLVFTGLMGALNYAHRGAIDVSAAALLSVTAVVAAPLGARLAHVWPEGRLRRAFGGFLLVTCGLLLLRPYFRVSALPGAKGWPRRISLLSVGFVTGGLSGLMGVGGGSITVPAMVLLLGMPQHVAQGSSLLAMVPAGLAGALTHARLGHVERRLLAGLIPGIVLGTSVGAQLALQLPEQLLRLCFAAAMLWPAYKSLRRS